MNIILLISIIIIFLIFVIFCLFHKKKNNFKYLILFSLLTSILNHGLTSNFLRNIDRITMIISFIYLLYYLYMKNAKIYYYLLLLLSVILYFISKYMKRSFAQNLYHILSHLCIIIFLILLIIDEM